MALRKPWSCSHLGNMGGGGSGECLCSGAEYAGEHLLPSRAARDLWDTSSGIRGTSWGTPSPAPSEPGPSHWDAPAQPSMGGKAWQEKKALSCASSCTKGLGETERGFHRYPRGPQLLERISAVDRGSHSCFWLFPIHPQGHSSTELSGCLWLCPSH